MRKATIVFITFSLLFQPLYFLMVWMFWVHWHQAETALVRWLDAGIIIGGIGFMFLQGAMSVLLRRAAGKHLVRRLFYTALLTWFVVEVVLSYWWCFETGTDPIKEHTPFVLLFLCFNAAQYRSLKKLGLLDRRIAHV